MSTGSTTSAFVVKPLPLCHQTPIMPRRSLQGKATPAGFGHARQKFETSLLSAGCLATSGYRDDVARFFAGKQTGARRQSGRLGARRLAEGQPAGQRAQRVVKTGGAAHAPPTAMRRDCKPALAGCGSAHTHHVRSPAAEVAAAHCRSDRTFPRFLRVRYSALTAAADVPGA